MAPVASPLREVSSRYSGREGGERASGRVTGCGAVGLWVGRWPQLRVSRLGCSEVEGFVRLWEPGRGPRTGGVGGNRPELSASDWRRGDPGSRRPAPGGLLPRPSSRAELEPLQLCLESCCGNRRAGWTEPSRWGPAWEEGARRVSPSAQRSGRGFRQWSVLRLALLARVRDLLTLFLLLLWACHQIFWRGDFFFRLLAFARKEIYI